VARQRQAAPSPSPLLQKSLPHRIRFETVEEIGSPGKALLPLQKPTVQRRDTVSSNSRCLSCVMTLGFCNLRWMLPADAVPRAFVVTRITSPLRRRAACCRTRSPPRIARQRIKVRYGLAAFPHRVGVNARNGTVRDVSHDDKFRRPKALIDFRAGASMCDSPLPLWPPSLCCARAPGLLACDILGGKRSPGGSPMPLEHLANPPTSSPG